MTESLLLRLRGVMEDLQGIMHDIQTYKDNPPAELAATQDRIVYYVTRKYGVALRHLTGMSRTRHISHPRKVLIYLMRKLTDLSLEAIGSFMGNRDHTTVIYAVNNIEMQMLQDPTVRCQVQDLEKDIMSKEEETND